MRIRLCLAVAVITLCWAPVARAWNSIGHMVVVKLACEQLSDGEKLKIFSMLKSHPHYDRFLAAERPAQADEIEWVLMRASIWSDWIRPRNKDNRGDVSKYHRGEEHYINIPFIDPKDVDAFQGRTLVSPDLTNILCSLKQRCNEVQIKTAAIEDKAVAICWIFHLIGDIHQPLHNVSYFSSKDAFKNGDLGGNKFGVKINGRKWKLHAYWDDLLGEDATYLDDSGNRQSRIFKQAVSVAESLRGRQLSPAEKESLVKNRTFESWSQEGFELARSFAYQKTDGTGVIEAVEARFDGPIPDDAPELGAEYAKQARAIAELRVILAAQRLAERMRMLLAK